MGKIVKATDEQVSSEFLDGEIVILNLKNGVYFSLDEVGARNLDAPTRIYFRC